MPRRENIKSRIAVCAWKLFRKKGYEETTVEDILEAAGTTKGTFYHYYSGKDALLISLSDVFDARYREIMQTLAPETNSYDKLLYLCENVHDMIEAEIPMDLLASLYSSQVTTRGDKHLVDRDRYYFRLINELVEEGQERGQITDAYPGEEIARLYAMCERAIIYEYCITEGRRGLGELTREMMPLMFGSVRK